MVGRLTGKHQVLFSEVDGTFPNHHPNPVDLKTLEILRSAVKSEAADLGIGFDGDGDRIGVVDARGRQVPGDLLTAYLAQDVAKRHPGETFLLDIKSSQLALDMLTAAGGCGNMENRPQPYEKENGGNRFALSRRNVRSYLHCR